MCALIAFYSLPSVHCAFNYDLPPTHTSPSIRPQHAVGKEVETVSISYNGKLIATGSRDGKAVCINIWIYMKDMVRQNDAQM